MCRLQRFFLGELKKGNDGFTYRQVSRIINGQASIEYGFNQFVVLLLINSLMYQRARIHSEIAEESAKTFTLVSLAMVATSFYLKDHTVADTVCPKR